MGYPLRLERLNDNTWGVINTPVLIHYRGRMCWDAFVLHDAESDDRWTIATGVRSKMESVLKAKSWIQGTLFKAASL